MINLDTALLRTLVTAIDLGGFGRAAERLGRTQSAVSLQMQRLEQHVGESLFRKQGRSLALTDAGEAILSYARRILEINDEAISAVKGLTVAGSVRLGLPEDFAETGLPTILARFARAHPAVRIEARVDRHSVLLDQLQRGDLDLALVFGQDGDRESTKIAELPIVWIGPAAFSWSRREPLPLVLFEAPCLFRQTALQALDKAGIAWRLTFSSPSLAGLWAGVQAGLGITIRTSEGLPQYLCALDKSYRLPKLPSVSLRLHAATSSPMPAVERLREVLLETLAENGEASAPMARVATIKSRRRPVLPT
jgi:DNA-binding transcriptional LysR family regulator